MGREYYAIRALCRAKILQHILDLKSQSTKYEAVAARDRANAWLRISNPQFRLFCELADYNPTWVIRKVEEGRVTNFAWRKSDDNNYQGFVGRYISRNYIPEEAEERFLETEGVTA